MYEIFESIINERGITAYRVYKETGVSQSTLSDWKNGKSIPSAQKLKLIADYLGVTVDYLMGAEKKEKAAIDVVDDGLKEYLDELRNRPEQRMLFSVTKTATKAQIEAIVKMVEEMQRDK